MEWDFCYDMVVDAKLERVGPGSGEGKVLYSKDYWHGSSLSGIACPRNWHLEFSGKRRQNRVSIVVDEEEHYSVLANVSGIEQEFGDKPECWVSDWLGNRPDGVELAENIQLALG
jgi:hypothetical protein